MKLPTNDEKLIKKSPKEYAMRGTYMLEFG